MTTDCLTATDRALWARTRTLRDVADLTSLWLQGKVSSQPNYYGPVDVDEHLAPGITAALVACNDAGWLTQTSQAGLDADDDHGHWLQQAWVAGYAPRALADRITDAAMADGYHVIQWTRRDWRARWAVTTCDMQWETADSWTPPRYVRFLYRGVGRSALREISAAQQLTIVDNTPGRNTLWVDLQRILAAVA